MKGIAGYVVAALVVALLGGVCLAAGLLDRQMARAQQDLATLRYEQPADVLEDTERYFEYASRVPWIGSAPLNDVRARRAAFLYWQQQYGAVAAAQSNLVGAVRRDNVALQMVVANAVYRAGAARAKDRASALQALNTGVSAYLSVLRNSTRNEDAAFNFEYLIRVRDDIVRGRRKALVASTSTTPHGVPGGPPPGTNMREFKIHIPMDDKELERKSGEEAGEGGQRKRRGND